jgi:hypothetical protein
MRPRIPAGKTAGKHLIRRPFRREIGYVIKMDTLSRHLEPRHKLPHSYATLSRAKGFTAIQASGKSSPSRSAGWTGAAPGCL